MKQKIQLAVLATMILGIVITLVVMKGVEKSRSLAWTKHTICFSASLELGTHGKDGWECDVWYIDPADTPDRTAKVSLDGHGKHYSCTYYDLPYDGWTKNSCVNL